MSRTYIRKEAVLEAQTTLAGDSEPASFKYFSKFRRDFERGYRKFWAKRGVDSSSFDAGFTFGNH